MPPKRKARPLPAEEAPPSKRITRSRGVILETLRETSNPGRVTRSRTTSTEPKAAAKRKSATAKSHAKSVKTQRTKSTRSAAKEPSPTSNSTSEQEECRESSIPETSKPAHKGGPSRENLTQTAPTKVAETERRSYRTRSSKDQATETQNVDESRQEPPKKRGRPRKTAKSALAQASAPPASQASTSKVTLEQTEVREDDEPRDVSTPPLDVRPVTPVRTLGSRAHGTPRYVLEVVVNTPSRQLGGTPLLHSVARSARASPIPATRTPRLEFIAHSAVTKQDNHDTLEPSLSSAPPSTAPDFAAGQDDDTPSVLPLSPEITPSTSILDEAPSSARSSAPSSNDALVSDDDSILLPDRYHSCLEAQKRVALKQLRLMPVIDDRISYASADDRSANDIAYRQLRELLIGTVERGEGNSCFLTGPRGSGKTQLVEQALNTLKDRPIVIRLSGDVETNDRLAVREIARQLAEQTGKTILPPHQDDLAEDAAENPFLETSPEGDTIALPPPAHLLALITNIPSLSRPTVIVIDAVDLFALHARQALLYCLFDTAQSCRIGIGTKGIAIVGVTSRIDTINTLEKRVKSRFSGRIFRTACLKELGHWTQKAKAALCTRVVESPKGWPLKWDASVNEFFANEEVKNMLKETFALTRDARVLNRLLILPILALRPSSPFLTSKALLASAATQRCPTRFPFLATLAYPSICLLIAAMHARTSGHDIFTFEMLHEAFRDQVRATSSAPVQFGGGGIGMRHCDREVLIAAYEQLVALRVFTAAAPITAGTAQGFARYRCALDRTEVKEVVAQTGQLNLRKWFSKS